MKSVFIIIALLPMFTACTIHDPVYYTIYTPVTHLTNSSPDVPQARMVTEPKQQQQTNNFSSSNIPQASNPRTARSIGNQSL